MLEHTKLEPRPLLDALGARYLPLRSRRDAAEKRLRRVGWARIREWALLGRVDLTGLRGERREPIPPKAFIEDVQWASPRSEIWFRESEDVVPTWTAVRLDKAQLVSLIPGRASGSESNRRGKPIPSEREITEWVGQAVGRPGLQPTREQIEAWAKECGASPRVLIKHVRQVGTGIGLTPRGAGQHD